MVVCVVVIVLVPCAYFCDRWGLTVYLVKLPSRLVLAPWVDEFLSRLELFAPCFPFLSVCAPVLI